MRFNVSKDVVVDVDTSLDHLIQVLNEIKTDGLSEGYQNFGVELQELTYPYDPNFYHKVVVAMSRPENDEEYAERLGQQALREEKAREIRRAQYEKLKAEFE